MKVLYRILTAATLALSLCFFASCADDIKENGDLNLGRCLQPMNLNAKVSSAYGNRVSFIWDVTKDAEEYSLVICDDKEMKNAVMSKTIPASAVPYVLDLDPDATYYFMVQATAAGKGDSKWAIYDKAIKTYAVKDNLFLAVTDRQANQVSFAWSKDVADYQEVDRIEYSLVGSEESKAYTLTSEDIANATATVPGLSASTEYVFTLYYASASRGQLDLWTMPDMTGLTEVSTSAALEQAIKDGANIRLTMAGSPYTLNDADLGKGVDVSKGVKIYGEQAADGSLPVIYGCISIVDAFDGGDLYFEAVEFNGRNGDGGFAFQHKEGSTTDGVKMGNITYKNCVITGYSKGIFYEWGKTLDINSFTYDSCDIDKVNGDGTGGGDGFDLRNATKIAKLSFVNNTISNGFRTFVRVDANPVISEFVFDNNTVSNLCFADNTNNGGLFAFQTVPGSFSLKNNLFLLMGEKAAMVSANTKYKKGEDLAVAASNNWFYSIPETFFNGNFSLANASGKMLEETPCFNAEGGAFNILPDSEISGKKVGASKWWIAYVEKPMDLTLTDVGEKHTWDFSNAKYFVGDIKKGKVSDMLGMYVESCPMNVTGGILNFSTASVTTRKGVPTDGFLAFKVSQPGSVVVKPVKSDSDKVGTSHIYVAVGDVAKNDATTIKSSVVSFKGGASPMIDGGTAQKILVSDITEESIVYVLASGPIGLESLAWSNDVDQVNTALGTPAVSTDPKSVTAGEATDVTVTWEAVDYAGSYSVVFNGSTSVVSEGLEYTIPGKTIGFLDAGAYKVEVYANPCDDDIYNTQSSAGTAAFAIVPKGGSEDGDAEFVVKGKDELLAAIEAGKSEITLDEGEYTFAEALVVNSPLALKGKKGAKMTVAFQLAGEVGTFSLENLDIKDYGNGCFITFAADGATASEIKVKDCNITGYSKSVIYMSTDNVLVDKFSFIGNQTGNWGTGQGVFDLRKGRCSEIDIIDNTIVGGRDLIRVDATVEAPVIRIINNTIDGVTINNSNGILYVRTAVSEYVVAANLFLNETGASTILSKTTGVKVPSMRKNFFYNLENEEKFFSGLITKDIATGNGGVVLTESPVKDAASGDYTLVSGLAISSKVGASKWNTTFVDCDEASFTVKSADEFAAALSAGKTEITLAAEGSPYTFATDARSLVVPAGLHLIGEKGAYPEFHGCFVFPAEGELGDIVFEGIKFMGDGADGNCLTVNDGTTANVRSVMMKDCVVDGYTKSVLYGNGGITAESAVFRNVTVQNHGTGQGVFDIRKGTYNTIAIENSTIIGGRDLIRADANTIAKSFIFNNNTVDGANLGINSNGIMYVRATPAAYSFKNNLFLNEVMEGKSVILAKTTGVTVPTEAKNNFFYNFDEAKFFENLFTKEVSAAVVLSSSPVKDAENHDYTLTDALCLSSNVGAARWNPSAGRVTTDYTASNIDELLAAIGAGKTAITLKYGVYDFSAVTDNDAVASGVLSISESLTLKGQKLGGKGPKIIGSIKLLPGVSEFVAQGIVFDGQNKTMGNLLEVTAGLTTSRILVRDCEILEYNKSLIYGNGEGEIGTATFDRLLVHDMGAGQGMFDLRKKVYGSIVIENSTIYNGGRDLVRCDTGVGESIAIRNNTFAATGIGASNGLLWVRSDVGDKYVVENNLFLNETGATLLAKATAKKAVMSNNWFFNCNEEAFWSGEYTKEDAVANGGGVLEADPCTNSAEADFHISNAEMRDKKVGDPRWR